LKVVENRELAAEVEHEKKVQQYEKRQRKLEKEKQKEVLDARTREITSYSLLVSNKNQLLKQIMEINTQTLDNKQNATKIAVKIDEIIHSNLSTDEEWDNFKMHFVKVHPHFFKNLTEDNLKMCAYIKIGLTNKQIAQFLHVAPSSIIISRYRLKKKMQLPDEEDLTTFIGNL
jgi:DNA-binding NarL/FixJ family response regulator